MTDDPKDLTPSDLRDVRRAVRNDWPVPPAVQARILQRLVDYLDRDHPEGATARDRIVIAAGRTLAAFAKVSLGQQVLDLHRDKLEGKKADVPLADLVREAERRAEERIRERAADDDARDR